jgi:hypothetical protein
MIILSLRHVSSAASASRKNSRAKLVGECIRANATKKNMAKKE